MLIGYFSPSLSWDQPSPTLWVQTLPLWRKQIRSLPVHASSAGRRPSVFSANPGVCYDGAHPRQEALEQGLQGTPEHPPLPLRVLEGLVLLCLASLPEGPSLSSCQLQWDLAQLQLWLGVRSQTNRLSQGDKHPGTH